MADITQHAKILVQTKGEPELMPFGDQIYKVGFSGIESETTKSYHAFRFKDNSEVVDAIVVGEVLDADYETIVKGEFTNYKIVQIYKDGQPVFAKGGGFKGGRGGYGKSPEEREEISRAVALKAAVNYTMNDDVTARSPQEVIGVANVFLPFLTGGTAIPVEPAVTKASTPKAPKAAAKQSDPTSPVVTADALKGLWGVAKDGNVKKEWLVAASVTLFQKADIKTITEDELSILTDKLAGEITRLNEENPF